MSKKIRIDFEGTALDRPHPTLGPPENWGKPDLRGVTVYSKEEALARYRARRETLDRNPGRPRMDRRLRSKTRGICLRDSEYRELQAYGEGSASTGIRFLLMLARRDLIDAPIPKRPKHKIDPPKSHLTKINPHTNKPWVNPDDADEEDFHS